MVTITEIEDNVEQQIDSNVNSNSSITEQLYQYTSTPVPAWTFAGLLLTTPLITKQPVKVPQVAIPGRSLFSIAKRQHIGPTSLNCLLFGGAMGLGGWIINEGDVESGSGFITAWSTLYLIVNGRSTLNGLRYGKIWPLLLTSVAGTSAYYHGKRFFFSSSDF